MGVRWAHTSQAIPPTWRRSSRARFCFRFEIADMRRLHIRARQAHTPSASVLELDRFEYRIGGWIGHGEHHGAVSKRRHRKSVAPKHARAYQPMNRPSSERARERAARKTRHAGLIERRGSIPICSYQARASSRSRATKRSPSAVRRAVGQAWRSAARCARGPCLPPGRAADQGVALRRRFAGGGRPESDCAVREVVRELNLYTASMLARRGSSPAAVQEIAAPSPPLALTHSPGVADDGTCSRTKKVPQKRS